MSNKTRNTAIGLFAASFTYYWVLSSKIFTWVYTSGDAGDWLALTNWWYVPQCFGKPLYVFLIKAMTLVPFGDDIWKLTFLSVISGAFIIMLTYLIAQKITNSHQYGILAALIVLANTIVLSQSTVIEQYTVLGAFFMAAFYFYLCDKDKLTVLFLGLASITHAVGIIFALILLAVEGKRIKETSKLIPLYILIGILPYAMVPILMYLDTPKLLAGGLSWGSFNTWGGNTTVTAALALTETPKRLYEVIKTVLPGLGLSAILIVMAFSKPWSNKKRYAVICFAFTFWFYFTNLFPSTWKFMTPTLPIIICYGVEWLKRQVKWQTVAVSAGAIGLVIVNMFLFNTDVMAHETPLATNYVEALKKLPEGACVVTPRGGAYGFALFYVMSEERPDLVPLALSDPLLWNNPQVDVSYNDYLIWLEKTYGVKGVDVRSLTINMIEQGRPVYFATQRTKVWNTAFIYETDNPEIVDGALNRVVGVIESPDWPPEIFPMEK